MYCVFFTYFDDGLLVRTCSTPYEENHDQTNRCPTLQEFGLEELPEPSVWHGGEKLALER